MKSYSTTEVIYNVSRTTRLGYEMQWKGVVWKIPCFRCVQTSPLPNNSLAYYWSLNGPRYLLKQNQHAYSFSNIGAMRGLQEIRVQQHVSHMQVWFCLYTTGFINNKFSKGGVAQSTVPGDRGLFLNVVNLIGLICQTKLDPVKIYVLAVINHRSSCKSLL